MRLSDMISKMGAPIFIEIGLVMFLLIFILAVLYSVTARKEVIEHIAALPLEDQEVIFPREEEKSR